MSDEPQRQDTFIYELLLSKASACKQSDSPTDAVSTAEPPESSSASCFGSVVARPTKANVKFLRNVSIHDPKADERHASLVKQTRELSERVFHEDCLEECTKKSGWKASILASDETLCGFIVAKVTNGALSIAKLAVPLELRGLGFGKLMMEECMRAAKKQGDVHEVCLSSLSTAVTFYQRLGFKAYKGLKYSEQEELVEGQVYMEKKLRARRGK